MDMWTCHSPGESANNPNTSLWLSRPLSLVAQSMRHDAPRLTSVEKGLWPLLVYNVFVRCAVRCAPQITEKSGIYIVQVEL